MPGSKSIRVFVNWFSLDSKSQLKELEICESAAKDIQSGDGWEWNSDKTCFWLKQKNFYYAHFCDACKKEFNYPVQMQRCPVCQGSIDKIKNRWIGRIESSSEKEWASMKPNELNEHFVSAAKQDLQEHPVHEEGFDWQHLKDNL